jgi:hypothetical protein
LVRDAIAVYLPQSSRSDRIAVAYLEKIVQIPVSLPRLPAHDAEAYVGLLLATRDWDRTRLDRLASGSHRNTPACLSAPNRARAKGRTPWPSGVWRGSFEPCQRAGVGRGEASPIARAGNRRRQAEPTSYSSAVPLACHIGGSTAGMSGQPRSLSSQR